MRNLTLFLLNHGNSSVRPEDTASIIPNTSYSLLGWAATVALVATDDRCYPEQNKHNFPAFSVLLRTFLAGVLAVQPEAEEHEKEHAGEDGRVREVGHRGRIRNKSQSGTLSDDVLNFAASLVGQSTKN